MLVLLFGVCMSKSMEVGVMMLADVLQSVVYNYIVLFIVVSGDMEFQNNFFSNRRSLIKQHSMYI